MPVTIYRTLAMGGIAGSIVIGLLVNLLAPTDVAIWFGLGTGLVAAAAVVTVGLHRHHTAILISLAASASSVASGQAGMATIGALAGLAIFTVLGEIQVPRISDLRR